MHLLWKSEVMIDAVLSQCLESLSTCTMSMQSSYRLDNTRILNGFLCVRINGQHFRVRDTSGPAIMNTFMLPLWRMLQLLHGTLQLRDKFTIFLNAIILPYSQIYMQLLTVNKDFNNWKAGIVYFCLVSVIIQILGTAGNDGVIRTEQIEKIASQTLT